MNFISVFFIFAYVVVNFSALTSVRAMCVYNMLNHCSSVPIINVARYSVFTQLLRDRNICNVISVLLRAFEIALGYFETFIIHRPGQPWLFVFFIPCHALGKSLITESPSSTFLSPLVFLPCPFTVSVMPFFCYWSILPIFFQKILQTNYFR